MTHLPEIPFHPVKPIKGGPPLSEVYRRLELSPDWMCQAKLDGRRVVWDGKILWSRQGNRLDNAVSLALGGFGQTLDGELMPDGHFWVYDLPDEARNPLTNRWSKIDEVVQQLSCPFIHKCPVVLDWKEVPENKWEGVVFKRLRSRYPKGRKPGEVTDDWVKFRAEWL